MKFKLLFALAFFTTVLNAQTVTWDWSMTLSSNSENYSQQILLDDINNIYVLGCYKDSLIFDSDTIVSPGTFSFFLVKFDSLRVFQWVKDFSVGNNLTSDMVMDNLGNIYLGISYTGGMITDGYSTNNPGYIAKINGQGDIIWSQEILNSGNSNIFLRSIQISNSGNLLIGGTFMNDIAIDTISRTGTSGYIYSYIFELDTSGTSLSCKLVASDDEMSGVSGLIEIVSNNSGYYVLLLTTGNYDQGNGVVIPSCWGMSLIKFDTNGLCQWAVTPADWVDVADFYCDDQYIYISGLYISSVTIDTCTVSNVGGNSGLFILKMNLDGHAIWLRSYNDEDIDAEMGLNISADSSDNIYVMVGFNGTSIFGNDTLVSNGNIPWFAAWDDIAICMFDSNGDPIWGVNAGDVAGLNFGSIYNSNTGDIYFVGYELINTSNKATDVKNSFIAKMYDPRLPAIPDIINGSSVICQNSTLNLYSISEVENTDYYVWYLPTGMIGSSDSTSILVDVQPGTVSGIISVYAINSFGISNPAMLFIEVYPQNDPVITFSNDTLFSDIVTNVQWYNSTGIIAGATDSIYIPAQTDTYYCIITENGCISNPSNSIYVDLTSISDRLEQFIEIYPNPTNGILNIKADNIEFVEIYDIEGKEMYSGKESRINLSDYTKGMCIIKITTNKGVAVNKILFN